MRLLVPILNLCCANINLFACIYPITLRISGCILCKLMCHLSPLPTTLPTSKLVRLDCVSTTYNRPSVILHETLAQRALVILMDIWVVRACVHLWIYYSPRDGLFRSPFRENGRCAEAEMLLVSIYRGWCLSGPSPGGHLMLLTTLTTHKVIFI